MRDSDPLFRREAFEYLHDRYYNKILDTDAYFNKFSIAIVLLSFVCGTTLILSCNFTYTVDLQGSIRASYLIDGDETSVASAAIGPRAKIELIPPSVRVQNIGKSTQYLSGLDGLAAQFEHDYDTVGSTVNQNAVISGSRLNSSGTERLNIANRPRMIDPASGWALFETPDPEVDHSEFLEHFVSIAPASAKMCVELYARASELKFLQQGMPVNLKYLNEKYARFGQFKGVISTVDRVALSEKDISDVADSAEPPRDTAIPLYRVWVSLDEAAVRTVERDRNSTYGSAVGARVPIETKRVYEWLLSTKQFIYHRLGRS